MAQNIAQKSARIRTPRAQKPEAAERREIEDVPTAGLIPYARNARTHSEQQVVQIAGSIQEFGFCNPVLIDSANGIIAGHGRVLAAHKLGLATVPCLRLGHLTEAQKRAYILADNRLALNAGWDEALLEEELRRLVEDGQDVAVLGFDENELTRAIGPDNGVALTPLKITEQPAMTWVLVGIPTVAFGSISGLIEQMAAMEGVLVETSLGNG